MLPNPVAQSKVYTIKRGYQTLSVIHRSSHYVLGFRKAILARRVIHNLHPEPKFTIIRDDSIDLGPKLVDAGFHDIVLNIDVKATIFVPKLKGDPLDPMNDAGFHMSHHTEEEFIMFPITKNLGVIIPTELQEENDDEYMFKALVMDPKERALD